MQIFAEHSNRQQNKVFFYFSTYEEFLNGLCKVNWLDPSNKGTREEQEEVLRILWNFSAEQEEKEEELYGNYDE